MNEGPQLYTFPKPLNNAQLGHLPPPILLTFTIGHDHTPQPTPISSTHPQPPLKVLCPTYGRQFTIWGLARHQHSCQTFDSSNPNPCDHPSLIHFITPTLSTSALSWVSTLYIFGSFHLNLCHPCLYNHIPIALWHDVQMAFRFPLNKLTHDLYNVVTWHLLLLLPHWCFALPPCGEATRHREMQIRLKHFFKCDWKNLQEELGGGGGGGRVF